MRFPVEGELPAPPGFRKAYAVEAVMVLQFGDGIAGHHPPREDEPPVAAERLLRGADQRVLAGPGRTYDQYQCPLHHFS